MPEFFDESALADLNLAGTLVNVLLALLLGQVIAWHFQRFGKVLSDRRRLARVLALLCATTMLMISVVKTSLALSLGLVGALSIVRFRTPIKEPEELAYLFLVIAAGIGIGADQRAVTVVAVTLVLGYMGLHSAWLDRDRSSRSLLQVELPTQGAGEAKELAEQLVDFLASHARSATLRRLDQLTDAVHGTVLLDLASADELTTLLASLGERFPGSTYSLVDREGLD